MKATQTLQMIGFSIILDDFGPKTTQKLQIVSFGTILDHFGPRPPRLHGFHFGMVSFRNNNPLETAFHSEWLRNNPKGPH